MAMIVRGFIEPIARELPMEYAVELNRLIELQMEGAVGSTSPTPASTSSTGSSSTTTSRTAAATSSTRAPCRARRATPSGSATSSSARRRSGTDTYELNRNLVLTDGARADSVPNLEIETGEIAGAGHASATGRFDDEQLFYLQARGIPEDEARRSSCAGSSPTSSRDRRARVGGGLHGRAVDAELEA
jgi:Fe-S cluster assembly scaffold protein SufB